MPDTPSFVVNDRRKFTADGELRHETSTDAVDPASAAGASPSGVTDDRKGPHLVPNSGPETASSSSRGELADQPQTVVGNAPPEAGVLDNEDAAETFPEGTLPPGPTDEETAEATRAYDATVDRLDTAMRAADPGGERMPEMSFERLTQSLYTQALLLLGGAAQPGENPRVDILGARQTIDMLAVLADKTKGNLTPDEDRLLQSALFDLRMGFLEITQALARQAAQRQPPAPGATPPGAGPRIVR